MGITLQAVTAENWRDVVELEVGAEQSAWVAPNAHSLLEAQYGFGGGWRTCGLYRWRYAGNAPVGMAMYNTGPAFDRFFIMRLMVDHRQQGRGLRARRAEPAAGPVPRAPAGQRGRDQLQPGQRSGCVYASCGFAELGPDGAGGVLMWQALNPQPEPWESLWMRRAGTTVDNQRLMNDDKTRDTRPKPSFSLFPVCHVSCPFAPRLHRD